MNDRELDDILKKALTPQNEIREEEILVQNKKREGKTMRRKRAKKFWVSGVAVAMLAVICILPQTSFAEQIKDMFRGIWGEQSALTDYVKRGVYTDQDKHMLFSVEEVLSDEAVVSAVVRYEALDETGEEWLKTKGPAGEDGKDQYGNIRISNQLYLQWGKEDPLRSGGSLVRSKSDKKVQYFELGVKYEQELGKLKNATLYYNLPTKEQKETSLDTSCNVPVYQYTLKARDGEQLSSYYEPKHVRITPLSAVIYGSTTEKYEKGRKASLDGIAFGTDEWGKNGESIGEGISMDAVMTFKDGSDKWVTNQGGTSVLAAFKDQKTKEKYSDCNCEILGMNFYRVTDYLGLVISQKIDPENVSALILKNQNREVTYELVPEDIK